MIEQLSKTETQELKEFITDYQYSLVSHREVSLDIKMCYK